MMLIPLMAASSRGGRCCTEQTAYPHAVGFTVQVKCHSSPLPTRQV